MGVGAEVDGEPLEGQVCNTIIIINNNNNINHRSRGEGVGGEVDGEPLEGQEGGHVEALVEAAAALASDLTNSNGDDEYDGVELW